MLPTRNSKYIDKLKVGGQKNMYYANNHRLGYQIKQTLESTKITRDREGRYGKVDNPPRRYRNPKCVFIKQAAKAVSQKLIQQKGEIGKSTIIIGDFNISLSIDRATRQNQKGYSRTLQHHQSTGSNLYL